MGSYRFQLRTDKVNQKGSAPIRIIYQQADQREYFPTNISCLPVCWRIKEQKAVYIDKKTARKIAPDIKYEVFPTEKEIKKLNTDLSGFINLITAVEDRFRLDGIQYTPKMVMAALKKAHTPESKRDEPGTNIVDFIERFIKETADHKEGTIKEYRGLANKMKEYENLKKVKFTFEGDASILKGFSGFLTTVKEINNVTKAKLFSTFKTMLRHAKKPPYKIKSNIDYFDFNEKSTKRKDGDFEVIALTEEEFEAIYNYDFSANRSLDEARDIFCFSCATSLRYGDLQQFQRKHIKRDNTIVIPMSDKNDKKIEIPLNPISYAILQKYADRVHPLPVTTAKQRLISNQKLNKNIKKIGELAGIDTEIEMVRPYGLESISLGMFPKYEWLSIHSGRKTFTTLSLARGMAIQEVMAITTHSSFKAVKRYIDITKERKENCNGYSLGSGLRNKKRPQSRLNNSLTIK